MWLIEERLPRSSGQLAPGAASSGLCLPGARLCKRRGAMADEIVQLNAANHSTLLSRPAGRSTSRLMPLIAAQIRTAGSLPPTTPPAWTDGGRRLGSFETACATISSFVGAMQNAVAR